MKVFFSAKSARTWSNSFCACSVWAGIALPAYCGSISGIVTSQNAVPATPPFAPAAELILESVKFSNGDEISTSSMVNVSEIFFFQPAPAASSTRILASPRHHSYYSPGQRHLVLTDNAINTGIGNVGLGSGLNIGPLDIAQESGLGITFSQPILNGPGADVILCHLDTVPFNPSVEAFTVNALQNGNSLQAVVLSAPSLVKSYSRQAVSPAIYSQQLPITSVGDFESKSLSTASQPTLIDFNLWFYEIDFSSVGILEGTIITGLFIQSDISSGATLDPTFIAGLHHVPEPGSAVMMTWALAGVAAGRRRLLRRSRREAIRLDR